MPLSLQNTTLAALSGYVEAGDLERMRVVTGWPGRWLPAALRQGAVTLGRRVFFREGRYAPDTPAGLALIAHEAVHVGQYRELGIPVFLAKYLSGNLKVRFDHDRHEMELPAIAVQGRVLGDL
ncbi:MAG: DUF4157 domain-containing protein [Dehalococcoidia bacterium]